MRENADTIRNEQRTYAIANAPAHGCTLWNMAVADGLQRRHSYFATEVKLAAPREKKFAKELKRFIEDIERREVQLREVQERECSRVGASLAAAVAKRWHAIGNTFTKQVRVEFDVVRQRKAQKKQEELLKETEALTSQLIAWVLERKRGAQERNNASSSLQVPLFLASDNQTEGDLPNLEHVLSEGQDQFDETKSLMLFNSLNGQRPLRAYQRTALQWMINLYTNDLNGILADEMGLGKTVQTIALLCYFAQYKQDWGPHLIVVPTTVVLNWQTELMRWAPGLRVITCIGSRDERVALRKGWSKPGAFDVCITSYNVFMRDQDSFRRLYWGFLVLDEAHHIKNFASQKWQALYELKTSYRLLLTGTPLQNNVMELWSLFHFLMPSATAFASHEEFEAWYSNPMNDMVSGKAALNEELIRRLQALIRPFLLRRLKKDVETQLPSKTTKIIKCHLSPRQRMLYDEFLNLKNTRQAIRSGGYQGVLGVILSLRKVCNHPDLFEPRPILSPFVMPLHEPIRMQVPRQVLMLANDTARILDMDACGPKLKALLGFPLPGSACVGLCPRSLLYDSASDAQRMRLKETLAEEAKPGAESGTYQVATPPQNLFSWAVRICNPTASVSSPPFGVRAFQTDNLLTQSPSQNSYRKSLWELPCELIQKLVQPYLRTSMLNGELKTVSSISLQRILRRSVDTFPDVRIPTKRSSMPSFQTSVRLVCLVQDLSISEHQLLPVLSKVAIVVPKCISSTSVSLGGSFGGTAPQLVCYAGVAHWRPYRPLNYSDIQLAFVSTPLRDKVIDMRPHEVMSAQAAWYSINKNVKLPKDVIRLPSIYADSSPHRDRYEIPSQVAPAPRLGSNLWPLITARSLNFPDKSMLIHDSGKLQILATLLPKLKAENHRCLIFTQFTVMLDILQKFLAMRGFPCLRIDGATGAVERQDYVERFNRDERITCMILSTRSGGIGLNLIGADTVIFYDSDWNPTIDLQAQDRCHRIGQTRSVTIYRLICANTVEEKILEKARERERLNSVVIRSGAFHITAWDHHEKAVEELKKQGEEDTSAATAIVSSGATSALLSRQDLRSFFKNVNDDLPDAEDDDDNANVEDQQTIMTAMDTVEDDADRAARRAATKEIHESEVAEQQDLHLLESEDPWNANVNNGTGADIPAETLLSQSFTVNAQETPSIVHTFSREELLIIKRQRQQILMRLPHSVERALVGNFSRLRPAKASSIRRSVEEEHKEIQ